MTSVRRRLHLGRRARVALRHIPVIGRRPNHVARRCWLLQMMPADSAGAEIGVWRGDFSAAILAIVHPRVLYLIDPWRSAADAELAGVLYDRPQTQMDGIFGRVVDRFAPQIAAGVIVIHRARSVDAAELVENGSLDWVYIDGDHSYDGVRADLTLYVPKVRAGGLVCGDDYISGGMFKGGVKRAVDEAVGAGGLELVTQRAGQFVLRVPQSGHASAQARDLEAAAT